MKKELGPAPLTIGGWLILVGIRLVGGIINTSSSIFKESNSQQSFLALIFSIISVLLLIFTFAVLAFLFKRHKAFPVCYIVLESFFIVSNIITLNMLLMTPALPAQPIFIYAVVPIIIGALWIVYMLRSERVKKTFVFSWNEKPDQKLVDKANGAASESI